MSRKLPIRRIALEIIEAKKAKLEKRSGGIYIGTVEAAILVDKTMGSEFRIALVNFSPGAKNKFHTHDCEQILYITSGKGIVATEKEEKIVTAGDVVFIPAGEKHWHGATEDSAFSHLYITKAEMKTTP